MVPSGQQSRLCRQCASRLPSISSRQFTTTRRRNAATSMGPGAHEGKLPEFKMPKMASMKSNFKNMGKKEVGDDLGRIPNALILPSAKELPSWTAPKFKRLRIHLLHLRLSLQNWFGLAFYLFWDAPKDLATGKKMRKPLELASRHRVARLLHAEFNTALGVGDMNRLQNVACSGLLSKAAARIEMRKQFRAKDEFWTIRRYQGIKYPVLLEKWPISVFLPAASTRVVSDRIVELPFPNSSLRQCTVRIRTIQEVGYANEKDLKLLPCTEYVVIQKMVYKGEAGPWKMWGTVEPSTMEEIDKLLDGKQEGTSMTDRLKEKFMSMASSAGMS
ncbi:uncharacterized protein Z518_05998 [Rhinocladiella mackenziei CBS 650.93]|uniref:Rhinocladiella mackenziei CBS 650.93 unplaced genomic scaffold supercont1.4, whole genome shotgun sequence n=1 Tax=Rhinocladiella mackenziei CBS 650.93 TaxID=1442369 RepID=A0A0D2IPP3_9EURO|nr:uncharacterized protein Z518_05998 [Rhinocladiella mackenziei CBS 650.93]KIX05126.1 hypothetical protein Z518_05998 [Rhinocladiella mackenziei CBS 650.93]